MNADPLNHASGLRLSLLIWLAAGLASLVPLYGLLIGPILFGVPHLVGDLRVLGLGRPGGFGGRVARRVAGALFAMTSLRIFKLLGCPVPIECEIACGVLAITFGAVGGARHHDSRVSWMLGIALVGIPSILWARETLLVLAHAHNFAAIALWLAWSPRRGNAIRVAASYVGAAFCVMLLPGVSVGDGKIGAFEGARLVQELAPGLSSRFAELLVRTFAFAQLVHYGIWSWDLPGWTSGSMVRDFGRPGIWLCALGVVMVPLLGIIAPSVTRSIYLQLAVAHGWFELAVVAYLCARGSMIPSH